MTRSPHIPVATSAVPPTSDELVYALSVLLRARPESLHRPELTGVLDTHSHGGSHGTASHEAPHRYLNAAANDGAPTLARNDAPRIVLTVAEAAERLGIGRTLMYSLVSSGAVESVTIGRLRRIPETALTAYVEQLRAKNATREVAA